MIEFEIGDSLELVHQVEDGSIDLILTDPPYNISNQGKVNFTKAGIAEVAYDWPPFDFEDLARFVPKLKPTGAFVCFCDNKEVTTLWDIYQRNGMKPKQILYWFKGYKGLNPRRNFNSTIESAVWAVCGSDYTWNGGGNMANLYIERKHKLSWPPNNYHPTQKSLEVIEWIIGLFTTEGGLVLDPFLGSGTTLAACRRMGRDGLGFEINQEYETIIRERILQDTPPLEVWFK